MACNVNDLNKQFDSLKSSYENWDSHFRELARNFDPGRQRFTESNTNKSQKFNTSMIDPTPRTAARTLAAGLMAGVTNPTVPWVSLKVDGIRTHEVNEWLYNASQAVLYALSKSNFYNIAPSAYSDLAIYSTANVCMESDIKNIIRFYHKPIGSYYIANGPKQFVDTWATSEKMTSSQIVRKFGIENCSEQIKRAYDNKDFKSLFEIRHLVMPRELYDPNKRDSMNMPYASYWFEPNSDSKILRESGFKNLPFVAVRWEVVGNDSYGSFAPGSVALGTAKGLQKDQRQRFEAQDKMINPPLNVPSSLRNQRVNIVPGGVNYVDASGGAKIESAYNINYPIQYSLQSIEDDRNILKSAFYNDLFIMIASQNTHQMTATEVAARKEEKLLMLGPVMNRITEEFLNPIVERVFNELLDRGLLGEPPEELEGADIDIEYTSILFQAQRAVGMGSIERVTSYIGNLAAVKPDVLDNFDADAAIREYSDIAGANPVILTKPEQVEADRQQRALQQQQQQMAAMAQPAMQSAQAAKVMSETDVGGRSALDMLTGQ